MIFIAGLAPDYVCLCAKITLNSHRCYKRRILLYKARIKRGQNLFALMSGLFLLLILTSPVLAALPEIEGIREQIRNKGARWQAAETSITQLSPERRLKRLGLLTGSLSAPEGAPLPRSSPSVGQGTTYLNYNEPPYNDVTPIRDQGDCGSCWAFSTTAALESQVLMATRAVPASIGLAEQILISCSGAGNCELGGYIDLASDFLQSTGLPPGACFPYTGTDNECSNAACPYWQSDTDAITGWQWVATTSPTVDGLKNALLTYGPLVTTMNVYSDFFSYAGGIYSYVTGSFQGGHAIEIIGYDDTNQCFIVKNSWGTGWGESEPGSISTLGFFRIDYNQIDNLIQFGYYTIAYEGCRTDPVAVPALSIAGSVLLILGLGAVLWRGRNQRQDRRTPPCRASG
jgi:hypothetical protein